jgi:hypothetical protein
MREGKPHSKPIARFLLLTLAAFFACGTALAQVKGYVVINPIAVCNSSGVCPTFGMKCGTTNGTYSCTKFNSPSAANQTTQSQLSTPISVVDADNNRNLTRATWIRTGLDVVFFPIQQWNSDSSNANPWSGITDVVTNSTFSSYTTSYQTIHTVNVLCNDGAKILASPDLQALTQRAVCDDHGRAANTTVAAKNPPPAPTVGGKPVPLAKNGCSSILPCSKDPTTGIGNSNAIDMLFLTSIALAPGSPPGVINGLSWINHNGVAIAANTTFPSTLGAVPLFGVVPHEIGHGMVLTHTDYGASTDGTNGARNLMTVGGTRIEPSTSGCFAPGTSSGGTNGGVLYDLAYSPAVTGTTCVPGQNPVADDLTLSTNGVACSSIDPTTCTSQQGAVLLSGFVNLSLAATATAGGGSSSAAISTAQTNSSTSKSGIPFQVDTFGGGGEGNATIGSVIFALAPGLDFQGNTPATQTSSTTNGPQIINQVRLNGNNGFGNLNCLKQIGLSPPSIHCLQIFFSGFTVNQFITFNLAITNSSGPLTLSQINQLAGTQFTVLSDNGNGTGSQYATTTTFQVVGGFLQPANSQFPDLSVPNQVNSATFVGATQTPCSPFTLSPSGCTAGELPQGQD